MEVVPEDLGDGNMQCINHPYKNSSPGGICAFCLQEKLGKLVSSSFTVTIFPSSSSSSSSPSSASFRSNFGAGGGSIITTTASSSSSSSSSNLSANASSHHIDLHNDFYTRRSKVPFLFKRSKSTTTPKRGDISFLDADEAEDYSPQRKGFWPFIYLSSKNSNAKKYVTSNSYASSSSVSKEKEKQGLEVVEENDDESPDHEVALDHRKVSRSRSVGCGSRSFSGDFFERISTGFGDCALRRVESQRENKPKVASMHRESCPGQDCIKERVKCGGIFSGFMVTSSSSSSASSSSYWVNSSSTEDNGNNGGRSASASTPGRSKNHWGWSFASPMRAFGKPSNNNGKSREASNKNVTPSNLAAIPSLLAVSG